MTRNSSPHPLDLGTSLKLKIVIIIYYKIYMKLKHLRVQIKESNYKGLTKMTEKSKIYYYYVAL